MSVAENQRQIFLQLVAALQPHWHTDRGLPERLQRLLARDRRFGSRDRRLYRELVYTVLRFRPWIEPLIGSDPEEAVRMTAWLAADTRDTRAFRQAWLTGWPDCPPSLADKARHLGLAERDLLPDWMHEECPAAFTENELECLHRRAPLWLRLQTDAPDAVWAEFAGHDWAYEPSSVLSGAVRLPAEAGAAATNSYFSGAFEVQDLGSQLVLAAHDIRPGEHWLDACAGAGGKSLQLARMVGANGHITATDPRIEALAELKTRAHRAGLTNLTATPKFPDANYDGVLIDAPCSGTGTWRRNPHLKWCTTPESLRQQAERQFEILQAHAPAVRPGGRLIYATCSLNRTENEAVIERFLTLHPEFSAVPPIRNFGFTATPAGLTIMPARHDTDGFFTSCLQRA